MIEDALAWMKQLKLKDVICEEEMGLFMFVLHISDWVDAKDAYNKHWFTIWAHQYILEH